MSVIVARIPIIGTKTIVFNAYEPTNMSRHEHSTITTINGKWYGTIGSRTLPKDLDALKPMSDERSRKVGVFHEKNYQEAYKQIIKAFPEAKGGHPSMGELVTYDGDAKRYGSLYRDVQSGRDIIKEDTFRNGKLLTEGRDRVWQNIMKMVCVNVTNGRKWATQEEWLTRKIPASFGPTHHMHGAMTLDNLQREIKTFEDSTKPGGVNAHLGATKVIHAEVIKGSNLHDKPTVTYDAPKFEVLESASRFSFKRFLAEDGAAEGGGGYRADGSAGNPMDESDKESKPKTADCAFCKKLGHACPRHREVPDIGKDIGDYMKEGVPTAGSYAGTVALNTLPDAITEE